MKTVFNCPCGETDPANFYKYRMYECKLCLRKKVAKGSSKPPACRCGETNPTLFYKNRRSKCKACVALHGSTKYKEMLADDDKRLAKNRYNLDYQKRNVFRYRCATAKRRADTKGITFDLDVAFLKHLHVKQGGKCFYSGITFDLDNPRYTWSIDRVDSSKGYTRDNVVLACSIINSMKNSLNVDEFIEISRRIIDYQDVG